MTVAAAKRALAQRARWLAPLVALIVAIGVLLFDTDGGAFALLDLRRRVAAAERHLESVELRRASLLDRIARLRGDDLAVEAAAREQLGMLRDGELVLRWSDRDAAAPAPDAARDASD